MWESHSGSALNPWSGIKNAEDQLKAAGTDSRTYDAFGNVLSQSANWSKSLSGYGGAFGYQEDGDSGLKFLGHRYYDPDLGRFLSRDPIKDGRNWYVYCENNPLTWADPSGLSAEKPGPGGSRYRVDLSQKPHPNMHIYHDHGETIINHRGGWDPVSGGHPNATPLPRPLRKPYRKLIRQFLKKVAKPLALITAFVEGPEVAARDVVFANEVEQAADYARDRLTEFTDSAASGYTNKRINRWLYD